MECSSRSVLRLVLDALRRGDSESVDDCRRIISINDSYLREFRAELEEYTPPDEYFAQKIEEFNESLGE